MGTKDPRVDAFIARAEPFARPILTYLRKAVHAGCPDVVESIKWGMPSFGRKGILCGMAAFKEHVAFGFWNGAQVTGKPKDPKAMWQYGRITSLKDLPSQKALIALVKKAVALDEEGVKRVRPAAAPKKAPAVPADLKTALGANKRARAGFKALTEAQHREYIEWITSAKREETRAKRVATTLEWAAEGKSMNWKYK
jgi:uncharacterized protein YdeI (YjbR/CyaY-like superfamily)